MGGRGSRRLCGDRPRGGSAVAVTCTCELLPGSWALEGRLGLLTGGPETQDSGWSAPQASDRPPPPAADVTVFRPSSFFILVQTGPWLQLQVQLVPHIWNCLLNPKNRNYPGAQFGIPVDL